MRKKSFRAIDTLSVRKQPFIKKYFRGAYCNVHSLPKYCLMRDTGDGIKFLTLEAPTPQNGQTHSNNSSANCRRII